MINYCLHNMSAVGIEDFIQFFKKPFISFCPCMKVNIDILCKYFSFLTYQRSVQLLYETLDILIEVLTAFTVQTVIAL